MATLASNSKPLRKTVRFTPSGEWRTLEVSGPAVLSVLGIASADDRVLANIPRAIVEFVSSDTLSGDITPNVLLAAALDPSLQAANKQTLPLVYWIAFCGDRPQGDPKAGDRQLVGGRERSHEHDGFQILAVMRGSIGYPHTTYQ